MRIKLLVAITVIAGIELGLPARSGAQANQQLIAVDNSGCSSPSSSVSSPRMAVPDSARVRGGNQSGSSSPDIILLASVQADRLVFRAQPQIRVRLCWGGDSVHVIQRTNLPSPVVPGTTYRDVYINLEILGHLNAECLASRITRAANDSSAGASGGSCAGLDLDLNRSRVGGTR
jgi:hypothetical protein